MEAAVGANDTQVGGDHYRRHTIQPWDVLKEYLTPEQFRGFLLGSVLYRLLRFNETGPGKGGLQDVQKGTHELEKLTEELLKEKYERNPSDFDRDPQHR